MRAQKRMSLAVIPVLLAAVACRTKTKAEAVQTAEKYMAAGEYGKAIIEYKNALKVEPRSAELQYKLGQAYEMLGNLPLAKKCYEQVTGYEGNPLAPDAHEALARLQQG